MIQMNLFSKQKQTHSPRKWTYGCRQVVGEGIVREFGMDMYKLLYWKWITNKDLLYSTWRRRQWQLTQYSCLENPWTEEPGRLQSMGLLGVGHDWPPSLSLFTFMHWRRKWQPTPVFLPGESQGRGSLVGCRLWGPTESDTTEAT